MKGAGSNGGFTLLEVLVALAVAAVALAAVSRVIGLYVGDSVEIQQRVLAHWLAQNLLTETQLTDPWPETVATEGESKYMGQTWRWRRSVQDTPFETIRKAEIQVFAEGGDEEFVSRTAGYLGEKTRW
jgi:general secretion pathway protein I